MPDRTHCPQADEWIRQMRRGDWEAAWRISDRTQAQRRGAKPQTGASGTGLPRHLQWVWDGTPLAGKRVLVRCYHGLGDTIQFIRFAPVLRQSAAHVTVWAQPPLLPLLRLVEGIDALLPLHEGACRAAYDVDIEVMELPHALRTTLATLPRTVPYIRLERNPAAYRCDPRLHVGLVWQSGNWDERRSVAPELLRPLTRLGGIRWKILQRGPALASWPGQIGEIPLIGNVLEEAAELCALDLLVCVDTMSAHLAGALGVRTWTLLPARADWRWMEERQDTPWYPTMRLFRQRKPGDWDRVIAQVARALTRETRAAPHPRELQRLASLDPDSSRANTCPGER